MDVLRKTIIWILAFTSVFIFIIVSFLSSIELVAFDIGHYEREYDRLDRAETIGISREELLHTTQELLNYLRDKRDDLRITAVIKGEERQVFNDREIDHMVDVKDLFVKGYRIRNGSVVMLLLIVVILLSIAGRDTLYFLSRGVIISMGILLILILTLAVLMINDFTPVWDQFHYIFFSNDLWILDPKTDILIQMVPEEFFFSTAARILVIFGIVVTVPTVFSITYTKKRKSKKLINK